MDKIVLISIDDGTVWDERLIDLLNQYRIPGTFNLNTGLEDFVWYLNGTPIRRLNPEQKRHIYRGHEIASHTLHHPCLTDLSEDDLHFQVGQDCENLKRIFGVRELGFAVPFRGCAEREIAVLKQHVRYVRLSEFREDYGLPVDPWHIYPHAIFTDKDVYEKINRFSRSTLPVSLFVLCGHSYEPEVTNGWEAFKRLLEYLCSFPDFSFMTTMEFVKRFYPELRTAGSEE